MKKKRFITSLVAIFTAVVMVLSLTGCQTGENSNAISQKEFMQGVKTSYENYVSAYKDYDTFGDITVSVKGSAYYSSDNEHTYTPEGASQAVTESYTDSESRTATVEISVKNIANERFLTAEYFTTDVITEHNTTETALEKVVTTTVETVKYETGVVGNQYFIRVHSTVKEGNEPLEEVKEYKIFENREAYVVALNGYLYEFNQDFVMMGYSMFDNMSNIEMLMMMPLEYTKDGDVFGIGMDISMFAVNLDTQENSLFGIDYFAKYSNKGLVGYDYMVDYTFLQGKVEMDIVYSSKIKAPASITDGGYVEGEVDGVVIDNSILEVVS